MRINILDCTLRDGGYVNDWCFSNLQIRNIITALENAQINVIECGYLDASRGKSSNSTLFNSIGTIDEILRNNKKNIEKVVMINHGDFDVSSLPRREMSLINGVRLAFHKKDLNNALSVSEKISSLGYKVYFQPMVTVNYSDLEFLAMIEEVNKINIYSFYIVDSFGSMSLKEFERYMIIADNNLKINTLLGYHSHNNMQLSFSNAINMCNSNLSRDILIDSSIYGIGRGAGNLNTELIVDYLNKTYNKNYKILPLLDIIDGMINSLMKKKPWGFSPAQYLSASLGCHPNYATYLTNYNVNHIAGVCKVLEKLDDKNKLVFDEALIEKLFIDSLLEVKTAPRGTLKIYDDTKVLLVASGKSSGGCVDLISRKKSDHRYLIVALNHVPQFECDYYFFSNQKRFDEVGVSLAEDRLVITSNIETIIKTIAVIDIKPLVYVGDIFVINIAGIFINYLVSRYVKFVEIIGLDGYKKEGNNYIYDNTFVVRNGSALIEQNKVLSSVLRILGEKINIELVTESIFEKDIKHRVLGVIPARYKSSRFEGKPLCLINGIPMIKRTFEQANKSTRLTKLIVATDDTTIENYCIQEKIPVIMTSNNCLTGTDRIAEVADTHHFDLYVNIQGDEPVIDPIAIDTVVDEFEKYGKKYIAYNFYKPIDDNKEINCKSIIKVIVNDSDELMYMSRHPIPFSKLSTKLPYKKQICVYGLTRNALDVFSQKNKTMNEEYEDIEILRFLDMGYKAKMKELDVDSFAVDVPEDVGKVEAFLNERDIV